MPPGCCTALQYFLAACHRTETETGGALPLVHSVPTYQILGKIQPPLGPTKCLMLDRHGTTTQLGPTWPVANGHLKASTQLNLTWFLRAQLANAWSRASQQSFRKVLNAAYKTWQNMKQHDMHCSTLQCSAVNCSAVQCTDRGKKQTSNHWFVGTGGKGVWW